MDAAIIYIFYYNKTAYIVKKTKQTYELKHNEGN